MVKITSQRGAGATGAFSFGPITRNRTVLSTGIVGTGPARSFCVILQGKGFYGSISATIGLNGKQILGRWANNSPAGWKTGTLLITRP